MEKTTGLGKAIADYLLWMISTGYSQSTVYHYKRILKYFLKYTKTRQIRWDDVFTFDTLNAFEKKLALANQSAPVRGLSRYLYQQKKILSPIKKRQERLPDIYEEYLIYYEKTRKVGQDMLRLTKKILSGLNNYLQKENIAFSNLKIEQLDEFLNTYNTGYAAKTHRRHRACLRGFLKYLYHERNIIRKDLGSLLVGAPLFAYANPPRFLRPNEIANLFSSLSFSTPKDLRTNAMVYLAYTLGLRPKEISLIRLNDICFRKGEITIAERKNTNPIQLPMPEDTLKAIAAYIIRARPKSEQRALFLNLRPPYRPVSHASVSSLITSAVRNTGVCQTGYSLRHTYAQNLLETGASIYEIKEMLGHDGIQTSRRYIHIHTKLMRKELFDEIL